MKHTLNIMLSSNSLKKASLLSIFLCFFISITWAQPIDVNGFTTSKTANGVKFVPTCVAGHERDCHNTMRYHYLWDFGDCTYSFEALPVHYYDTPGDFTASLTVSNIYDDEEEEESEEVVSQHDITYKTFNSDILITRGDLLKGKSKLKREEDFPLEIHSSFAPRAGFYIWYQLHYDNNTSRPKEISLQLTLDSLLSNVPDSSNPEIPYSVYQGGASVEVEYDEETHTFSFSPGSVAPNTGCDYLLRLMVHEECDTTDSIQVKASIMDAGGEIVNASGHKAYVGNSWDPNAIRVFPKGPVQPGDTLTYIIFLENIGQVSTTRIKVIDTLPDALDVSTIKFWIPDSSRYVMPEIKGNIITWDRPYFLTPFVPEFPRANQRRIFFKVVVRKDLKKGTRFFNRAHIIFDDNPPIVTNRARNYIPPLFKKLPIRKKKKLIHFLLIGAIVLGVIVLITVLVRKNKEK